MENPTKIGNHNKSMNYIIGNMSSMIAGACMESGIHSENTPSRPIIWQPTIYIVTSSQTEVIKISSTSDKMFTRITFKKEAIQLMAKVKFQRQKYVLHQEIVMKRVT